MDMNFRKTIFSFALVIFLIMGTVAAQPGIPNHFYGDVTINGASAPDGVLVEARVSGNFVAGTTTSGGTYGQASSFYVPNPHGTMDGKTIEFYVQNVKAAEHTFSTANPVVELDLAVTIANFCGDGKCEAGESCSSCSKDCGVCTPPSGGGGGGGGGSSGGTTVGGTNTSNQTTGPCVEDWICTAWTECVGGKKIRTCADVNRCGTNSSKPVEREVCLTSAACEPGKTMCRDKVLMACSSDGTSWIDLEECEFACSENGCVKGWSDFMGLITGMTPAIGGIGGIVVVALLLLYVFRIRRRK
jgi:hypothetical protein